MGLSRRLFTQEFKLAAIRRLEKGVSIGHGGWKSTPTYCIAGGGSSEPGPATRFRVTGSSAGAKAGSRNWNVRSASRRWRSIF